VVVMVIAAATVIAAGWIDDAAAKGACQGKDGHQGRQAARLRFAGRNVGHDDLLR
jgi:hypothetical protein